MHPARPSIVAPLLAWLAVSAVCDAAPPTAAAEPVVMKTIDDARLYDLLVAELAAVLDGRQRLAPLPRNVSDVAIGPRGEPCFIVPGTPDTRPEALETAVARAGRQEPGFRVLWEARLLGHDGDDALAIAITPESRVAVIEGKTSRNISLPPRNPPSHAIRVGGRWIFLTPGGIAGENETTFWPDSGRLHVGVVKRLLRMGDDGMAAVQNDPNRSPSLWYGIRTAGTWTTGSLAGAPEPLRSAVRLADGRWLAIGQHIVESRADRPPRPTEAQLEATLAAARAADWAALAPLLEAVSTYPPSDTAGLANLLQKIPPRNQALRSVTTVLENARRELARIPATEGLDQQQTDQVREILAACEKQLGATAKNLASAVPDVLLRSPADISARLQSGMQFYRGRWLSVLDVVRQETLDSALLWVKLGNTPDEPSGTLALARLEADGGLRIVQEVKEVLPYGQASMVAAPAADVAYFVTPGRGIARVSATGVDWISTRARSPVQLIGADARGRVYFRKTEFRPGGAPAIDHTPQLWVLTPDGVEEQTPVANWPTFGQPVAAADGSIWFLQPQRQRSAGPMQPDAAPAATPGIEVKQIDVTSEPAQDPAVTKGPGFQGRPDGFEGPRLCRLTGPRSLTEYVLPGPALTATALHAGRDAAWFTAASRVINMPQNPLAFLAGNVLRTDKDLHGLAERSFDALLAAAPDALPLESWREIVPNVDADAVTPQQLLRTGDLLWVNAAGRVEIYARGRPLSVNDRLVLRGLQLHGARVRPLLVGPLRVNGRTSVLLRAAATEGSGYTWITPNDNGVQIDPVATLPADQRGYFPSWLGNVPLVATDRSAAFFNCSEGRVWKILGPQTFHLAADAGTPFLGLREADAFLATRSPYAKRGVRLCKPGARIDVPVLASRRLDPVAVAANGRILCLQPDGLSWLAPHPEQGYVVAATRRLPDGLAVNGYVGRLDGAEVITAFDGSQQRVVMVPDAPAEAAAP